VYRWLVVVMCYVICYGCCAWVYVWVCCVGVLYSDIIIYLASIIKNEKLVLVGAFSIFGRADTGKPVQIRGYISENEANLVN